MCSNSSARLFPLNTTTRTLHAVSCPLASVLSFPRLLPVSPVPVPYCSLADTLSLLRPRPTSSSPMLCLFCVAFYRSLDYVLSPNPVFFRLDPVSFRPRSKDPFVSTSRLFVSYPVSFRFVPRVFSSRSPCSIVLSPGFFRPQPRVISYSSASVISCYHASVFLATVTVVSTEVS